jgi:hypothetical protein
MGGEPGMTRRRRDLLLGVVLALVAFAGAAVQVETSEAHRELPSLVCPLH